MDNDQTPTAPYPLAAEAAGPEATGSPSPGVWNEHTLKTPASTDPGPRRSRASTMLWGVFLIATGAVCLATGLGAGIDPVMAGIVLLAGLGVLLLLAGLLPRKKHLGQGPAGR